MKVGFVGLGRMGQGMARRLLDAGHDLSVYDVFTAQAAPLAAAGAQVASSVAELAARSEVVVTMLVEDSAVTQVGLGPRGICESLPKGAIHLVMGTHGASGWRHLAFGSVAEKVVRMAHRPVLTVHSGPPAQSGISTAKAEQRTPSAPTVLV